MVSSFMMPSSSNENVECNEHFLFSVRLSVSLIRSPRLPQRLPWSHFHVYFLSYTCPNQTMIDLIQILWNSGK